MSSMHSQRIRRSSSAAARLDPAVEVGACALQVGARAPDVITGPQSRRPAEPRVLAFVRDAAFAPDQVTAALRAQLRGLGAELLVLAPAGAWRVSADDPPEPAAVDVTAAAAGYGVVDGREAVFVIDGRGIVRFAHRPDHRPDHPLDAIATLADALAIATEAVHARDAHGARDRVLFTRREWNVTCLVVGFATAYLSGCKQQRAPTEDRPAPARAEDAPPTVAVTLTINGQPRRLRSIRGRRCSIRCARRSG